MPITMSTSARYVTQSSVYTNQFTGPLTSRRIEHYRKLGYYGPTGILALSKQQTKKKHSRKGVARKELTLNDLLAGLV